MAKLPTIKDLAALVRHVSKQVPRADAPDAEDYIDTYSGDTLPSIDLTVGWSDKSGEWSYQTGDNSFTGGAYGFPHWAVVTVYRKCNSIELAREIQDTLEEATW